MNAAYVGIAAGILTSTALLPQLIKIIREKKAQNISYFMLVILMCGLLCWIWYGTMRDDLPIIITNAFSLTINLLVLIFTIKYKDRA